MIISDLSYLEDVSQELSNKTATAIPRGGTAKVYRDNNYQVLLGVFEKGKSKFSSNGNDKVSSIDITSGEIWQVCSDAYYRGTCVLIDKDYADIDLAGLPNDTMSSIRKL